MDKLKDKELITGLKKGEKESFRILFHRFYSVFVRFVYKIIHEREAAEDIVQEVFMKIWLNRENLDENGSIENYLYILSKRSALSFIRDRKISLPVEKLRLSSKSPSPDIEVITKELYNKANSTVEEMPLKRRIVYNMSREQDLSNKEIARSLDISEKTVERHITLALSDLRKKLFS